MDETAQFYCGQCGSINTTSIDPSQGQNQTYVEDCQVCCRPNVIRLVLDDYGAVVSIEARLEGR